MKLKRPEQIKRRCFHQYGELYIPKSLLRKGYHNPDILEVFSILLCEFILLTERLSRNNARWHLIRWSIKLTYVIYVFIYNDHRVDGEMLLRVYLTFTVLLLLLLLLLKGIIVKVRYKFPFILFEYIFNN